MNLHLVSFGSTYNYHGALMRMNNQASNWQHNDVPVFSSINIFNEHHLQTDHADFWNSHVAHIAANPRGFGYWIWKSYLVRHVMQNVPQGDIVLWMDLGCQINERAHNRFQDYYNLAQEHGLLCFASGWHEYTWTKGDTAQLIVENNPAHMESDQIISGIMMWRNDQFNRQLVDDWANISVANGYQYITDAPSLLPNWPEFREHRHDQSILSLLVKKYGRYHALSDETWKPNWHVDVVAYPIWATRNRTKTFI